MVAVSSMNGAPDVVLLIDPGVLPHLSRGCAAEAVLLQTQRPSIVAIRKRQEALHYRASQTLPNIGGGLANTARRAGATCPLPPSIKASRRHSPRLNRADARRRRRRMVRVRARASFTSCFRYARAVRRSSRT